MFIMAQCFSTLIYMVEPRDNIQSIPDALWFTIITMTTVGYGEVTPTTPQGKIITLVLVVASALYMAVPIGIVGSAFDQVWKDKDKLLIVNHVRERLHVLGIGAHDIPYLFGRFGGMGVMTLEDFQLMMAQMHLSIPDEKQLELFGSFDTDGSGEIGPKEFVRGFFPKAYAQIYGTATRESFAAEQTAAGAKAAEQERQDALTKSTVLTDLQEVRHSIERRNERMQDVESVRQSNLQSAPANVL